MKGTLVSVLSVGSPHRALSPSLPSGPGGQPDRRGLDGLRLLRVCGPLCERRGGTPADGEGEGGRGEGVGGRGLRWGGGWRGAPRLGEGEGEGREAGCEGGGGGRGEVGKETLGEAHVDPGS